MTKAEGDLSGIAIAVILPCYNEAASIARTVAEFRDALPGATVYVYDNRSTDATADRARAAGAVVRQEGYRGKGNVVRRMFADVEADVYVMADGDATYDASAAPAMVRRLVAGNLDMVNGARRDREAAAYRRGHRFGNRLLTRMVRLVFGRNFDDMLSGYRVFSRRFVKSFPAMSRGFEIETELTVHALDLRMPTAEIPVEYRARGEDSTSKLSTWRDGLRILRMIGFLAKEERPLQVFSLGAFAIAVLSVALFGSVLAEFLRTGLVERLPTLFVSLAGLLAAALSMVCAMILDTVSRGRRETRRLHYLAHPAPGARLSARLSSDKAGEEGEAPQAAGLRVVAEAEAARQG